MKLEVNCGDRGTRVQLEPSTVGHDIAGDIVSSGSLVEVKDAPDSAIYALIPSSGISAVDQALDAATRSAEELQVVTDDELSNVLHGAARLLETDGGFPEVLTRETGKPISEARRELNSAARVLTHYAQDIALSSQGRYVRSGSRSVDAVIYPEPLGPAVLITPWNMPVQVLAHKLGAALAARCPVIIKPSPLAPVSAHRFVRAIRGAGLPPRFVSIVHGFAETALALASSEAAGVISFTGGADGGAAIREAAAVNGTRAITELGGKSPNILFDEQFASSAIRATLDGIVRNQGATCTAPSRFLVSREQHESVVERFANEIDVVTPGDPFLPATKMGAIRSIERRDELISDLRRARTDGAHVVGGTEVNIAGRGGAFMTPAMICQEWPADDLVEKELFGPVVVIEPFDDEQDLLERLGRNDYGLSAGVWTKDIDRAMRMARKMKVGTVHINHYGRRDSLAAPSSGRGQSGHGAEGGIEGIRQFQQHKSVHISKESD